MFLNFYLTRIAITTVARRHVVVGSRPVMEIYCPRKFELPSSDCLDFAFNNLEYTLASFISFSLLAIRIHMASFYCKDVKLVK